MKAMLCLMVLFGCAWGQKMDGYIPPGWYMQPFRIEPNGDTAWVSSRPFNADNSRMVHYNDRQERDSVHDDNGLRAIHTDSGGVVIYNEAARDLPPLKAAVMEHPIPGLWWEIRADSIAIGWWDNVLHYSPTWWLYVTQTIGDTVRQFRVCQIGLVEEE